MAVEDIKLFWSST